MNLGQIQKNTSGLIVTIMIAMFVLPALPVLAAVQPPPISLIDQKIQTAGIPIHGISGWPVERIDFKPEATEEQRAEAWDIAKNFDYEKELKEAKSGEGLVTYYGAGAPELTEDGQITVAEVNGSPYIYFRANGETHHILGSASFEISPKETVDALSGEKMQIGDFVIGMIDKNLANGDTPENSSLHGIWVKFSSVLSSLGIAIQDGITKIKNLAVETFFAKTARVEKLEFVDQATGEIYCTWMENGVTQNVKGECDAQNSQNPIINDPLPASEETPVVDEALVTEEIPADAGSESEPVTEEPVAEEPIVEETPQIEETPVVETQDVPADIPIDAPADTPEEVVNP